MGHRLCSGHLAQPASLPPLRPAGVGCGRCPIRREESRCGRLGNRPKVAELGSGGTPGAPAARGCSLNHVASTAPSAGGTGGLSREGCRVTRVGPGHWGGGDGDALGPADSPLATPLSRSESPRGVWVPPGPCSAMPLSVSSVLCRTLRRSQSTQNKARVRPHPVTGGSGCDVTPAAYLAQPFRSRPQTPPSSPDSLPQDLGACWPLPSGLALQPPPGSLAPSVQSALTELTFRGEADGQRGGG